MRILNDFTLDYKSRLISLQLLPLIVTYEINDLEFFLLSLINILASSHSSLHLLVHLPVQNSSTLTPTFTHLATSSISFPCFEIVFPPMHCCLPLPVLCSLIKSFFCSHFLLHFDPSNPCTFHMVCPCNKCLNYKSTPNFILFC